MAAFASSSSIDVRASDPKLKALSCSISRRLMNMAGLSGMVRLVGFTAGSVSLLTVRDALRDVDEFVQVQQCMAELHQLAVRSVDCVLCVLC